MIITPGGTDWETVWFTICDVMPDVKSQQKHDLGRPLYLSHSRHLQLNCTHNCISTLLICVQSVKKYAEIEYKPKYLSAGDGLAMLTVSCLSQPRRRQLCPHLSWPLDRRRHRLRVIHSPRAPRRRFSPSLHS